MITIFAATIAVVGTLGGTLATGLLQQRQTKRTADIAKWENGRQERLTACISYAQAIAHFRGTQIERLIARRDSDGDNAKLEEARAQGFRARTDARGALFRVQLLIDDEEVVRLAKEAMTVTIAIVETDDTDGIKIKQRADRSREATDAFVTTAARRAQVQ